VVNRQLTSWQQLRRILKLILFNSRGHREPVLVRSRCHWTTMPGMKVYTVSESVWAKAKRLIDVLGALARQAVVSWHKFDGLLCWQRFPAVTFSFEIE
jgi:hypothetical protein